MIRVEDERGDALGARSVRVGAREEEERACEAAGRDELLRAGDRPAVVLRRGAAVRSEPASDPASVSVSAKAPITSPRASGGTKRDALLVGAEGENRQRDGARVHGHRHADPRVGARELLEDEDVGEEVGARPAVLLRHADAHQAELGELAEELLREVVLAVPLGRVRLDLGLRELARERLDLPLVGGQLEVHLRVIVEARARLPCRGGRGTCSRSSGHGS